METPAPFLHVYLVTPDADPLTFRFWLDARGHRRGTVEVPRAAFHAMPAPHLAAYVADCYLEDHPAEQARVGRARLLKAVARALPR